MAKFAVQCRAAAALARVVLAGGGGGDGDGRTERLGTGSGRGRRICSESLGWLPGALADHLTSFGGQLDTDPERAGAQTTALQWIASGATASYGSVSEPCNHLQKFPHSQVLLLNCLQGATAIEACWKSVAWPQQGLFVGEALLAPFAAPFTALRP